MVSFTDALNYVAYKNPVSQFTIAGVSQLAKASVSVAKLYFQRLIAIDNIQMFDITIGFTRKTITCSIDCFKSGIRCGTDFKATGLKLSSYSSGCIERSCCCMFSCIWTTQYERNS